jgi:hypothetical protein
LSIVQEELIIKFEGSLAEQHRLPAYLASKSFYGIARSTLITLNYLAEGRVRRREFSSNAFRIDLVAHRPGSFEAIYQIIANIDAMNIAAGLGSGVAGNFLTDFIRSIFRRTIGQSADPGIEQLESEQALNAGDLSALQDAIEPAIKEAHSVINHGAGQIFIINGDKNIVNFDRETKQYVWTAQHDDSLNEKLFSIASYNANTRSGRAFDYEIGKTIPFEISPDADRDTFSSILSSMSSYTMRRLGDDLSSAIALRYTSIVTVDSRIKKLLVTKARRELSDLHG